MKNLQVDGTVEECGYKTPPFKKQKSHPANSGLLPPPPLSTASLPPSIFSGHHFSLCDYENLFSSMNRRLISSLSANPQPESQSQSETSLSPTAMGYAVDYADVSLPNVFLYILFFLGYIRSLIVSIFKFLGLSDFLESETPTSIFHDRYESPKLIDDFVPVFKFSDIPAADGSGAGFPPECCAVCLCEFQDDEEIRFLKNCKHIFHKECLDRWMIRDRRSCPLCRTLILPEDFFRRSYFSDCSEFSGDLS